MNEKQNDYAERASLSTVGLGWQPIETAPKGVDWILLGYFPDHMEGKQQGGHPEVAFWNGSGWINCCGIRLSTSGLFSPTHWRHFPEAPNVELTGPL